MAADANWTIICPHCGAASEDDAICRACGKLLDESQPVRPFSARRVIDKVVASWNSHPTPLGGHPSPFIEEEPEVCPSWRMYQGNIYHWDK